MSQVTGAGAQVRHDRERDLLTINDEFTASVSIGRGRELTPRVLRYGVRR